MERVSEIINLFFIIFFSFETSHCEQNPMLLLLALLTAVPTASGLVDCQTACRRCRVAADPLAVVEVYCNMCQECKWKARRRKQVGRRADIDEDVPMNMDENLDDVDYVYEEDYDNPDIPDAELMFGQGPEELRAPGLGGRPQGGVPPPVEYEGYSYEETLGSKSKNKAGYYKALELLNIPEGCPTPPICDSDGEPPEKRIEGTTTTSPTTTTSTTTTTTQPPTTCPPIPQCIETTKPPRRIRTTPYYPDYEVQTPPRFPYPCMPCMPMCPCPPPYPFPPGQQGQTPSWPPPWPPQWPPQQPGESQQQQQQQQSSPSIPPPPTQTSKLKLREEIASEDQHQVEATTPSDFMYVYVGVPKELARQV